MKRTWELNQKDFDELSGYVFEHWNKTIMSHDALLKVWDAIPESVKSLINEWGWNDTEVREFIFEMLTVNSDDLKKSVMETYDDLKELVRIHPISYLSPIGCVQMTEYQIEQGKGMNLREIVVRCTVRPAPPELFAILEVNDLVNLLNRYKHADSSREKMAVLAEIPEGV